MKKITKLLWLPAAVFALIVVGCGKQSNNSNEPEPSDSDYTPLPELDLDPFDRTYSKYASDSAYVRKVEGLTPSNFILGMDASSVIAEEASGVKYYDFNGQESDVFKVLSDSGVAPCSLADPRSHIFSSADHSPVVKWSHQPVLSFLH